MRKLLLLSAVGLFAAQGMFADGGNYVVPNFYTMSMSPNGQYMASQDFDGSISLWDIKAKEMVGGVYMAPGAVVDHYSIGMGNFVSNNGLFVGSTSYGSDDVACIYDGMAWMPLCTLADEATSGANGITSDGKMICGFGAGVTGQVYSTRPVYWDIENGMWSIHDLPYPLVDWSGQTIQYSYATSISNDGKIMLGEVKDNSGMCNLPILFRQNADGEWTYELLGKEIVNPDKVELPPYPVKPDPTTYMTAEDKAAYEAAMAEWRKNPLGLDRPNPEDYITDADKLAEYKTVNEEYETKLAAYEKVYYEILAKSGGFVQNCARMSPNGRYVTATAEKTDENWNTIYDIWVWDTTDGSFKIYPNESLVMNITDDGDVAAADPIDFMAGGPQYSYIKLADSGKFVPMVDYIQERNADAYAYAKKNLVHDYQTGYDEDTYEPIIEKDVLALGMCYISNDKSVLSGTQLNMWYVNDEDYDPESEVMCLGYVLSLDNGNSGVDGIAADDAAAPVEYYTVDGLRVENPAAGQLVIRRQGSKSSKVVFK